MEFQVVSARYVDIAGWGVAVLVKLSSGEEFDLPFEQKYVSEGWVFLGAEWEKRVPERRARLKVNPHALLRGFTDDPTIVALARNLIADLRSGKFQSGPVELPNVDRPG